MVGDAGEVVECLPKLTRKGDRPRERLAGELGDVWPYWTRRQRHPPTEVLGRSRAKIEERLTVAGQMKGARLADNG